MSDIKYSKQHEYVKTDGDMAIIGISDYAQQQLGDIVFVEMPQIGKEINKGDEVAVIESVKAASELYAPISGTIVAINEELDLDPSLLNSDPENNGWIFKMEIKNKQELDDLMDKEKYALFIDED